jgi:hypothetical protein
MRKCEAEDELRKRLESVNPITARTATRIKAEVTLDWFVKNRWKPMYEGNWREGSTADHNDWIIDFILDAKIHLVPGDEGTRLGDVNIMDLDVVPVTKTGSTGWPR